MSFLHNFYVVIFAMAAAVYACRAGGYWLAGRVSINDRVHVWLSYLPGALMVSIVLPLMKTATPAMWIGAVVVALVMVKSDNLLTSMSVGIALVIGLRLLGFN